MSSNTQNNEEDYPPTVILMGGSHFLYLRDEDGARLIRVDGIMSIVPNFRLGGSMIFLSGANKAITVAFEPHEIYNSLT